MGITLKQQFANEYFLKDFLERRCNKCLKALNCSLIKKARQGKIQSGLFLGNFKVIQCRDYSSCRPSTPKEPKRKCPEDGDLFPGFVYEERADNYYPSGAEYVSSR